MYEEECKKVDEFLRLLKRSEVSLPILKKAPTGVDRERHSEDTMEDEEERTELSRTAQVYQAILEKYGFPQPKDQRIRIRNRTCPYASWEVDGTYNLKDAGHYTGFQMIGQTDPGRFLHAWLVDKRLELLLEEAVCLFGNHIRALAKWHEGLKGMKHKLLRDDDLQCHFDEVFVDLMHWPEFGERHGVPGKAFVAVLDPKHYPADYVQPATVRNNGSASAAATGQAPARAAPLTSNVRPVPSNDPSSQMAGIDLQPRHAGLSSRPSTT